MTKMRIILKIIRHTFLFFCFLLYQTVLFAQHETGLLDSDSGYDTVSLITQIGSKDDLPHSVDLKPYCPMPGNQGRVSSCVGWSVGYGLFSIEKAIQNKMTDTRAITDNAFSALFVYNQIREEGNCSSRTEMSKAFDLLKIKGNCLSKEFDIDKEDCYHKPNDLLKNKAKNNAIAEYSRLFDGNTEGSIKREVLKKVLAQNKPVAISLKINKQFQLLNDADYWYPNLGSEPNESHAMVIVGYDDETQSFTLLNSWGKVWGRDGFIKIKYKDLVEYCRFAFVIYLSKNEAFQEPIVVSNHGLESASRHQSLTNNPSKTSIPPSLMANQQATNNESTNNQPQITNNQPQITNNQPRITNNQPQITNNQPQITNNESTNNQPRITNNESTNNQPQITNNQPQITNNQSTNHESRITNNESTNNQPRITNNQPQITNNQPQITNNESTNNQPRITNNESTNNESRITNNESRITNNELVEMSGRFEVNYFTGRWTENKEPIFEPIGVERLGNHYQVTKKDWRVGDAFQLALTSDLSGAYVYILSVNPRNEVKIIFPRNQEYGKQYEGKYETPLMMLDGARIVLPSPNKVMKVDYVGKDRICILFSTRKIWGFSKFCDMVQGWQGDFDTYFFKLLNKLMIPNVDSNFAINKVAFSIATRSQGSIIPIIIDFQSE